MSKRLQLDNCCSVLVDIQEFFLKQLPEAKRVSIEKSTSSFLQLVTYLRMPVVVTLERPVAAKGELPASLAEHLNCGEQQAGEKRLDGGPAILASTSDANRGATQSSDSERSPVSIMQKDYFDLTREGEIADQLRLIGRKQILLTGCETDVCILQSCLGLIAHGFEVFVIEDLLFSSSERVSSAIERMRSAGATFLTYKSLYHELLQSVDESPRRAQLAEEFGPFPDELRNFAFD